MTRRRKHLWAAMVLLVAGCAAPGNQPGAAVPPAQTPAATVGVQVDVTKQPEVRATAVPASLPTVDDTWQTLYERPGFSAAGSVDLRAVGDIMLARNVEPVLRKRPAEWLLEPTAGLLNGDITVGNLESPFASVRRREALRPGPYRLPADPALVATLGGFDVLSLANNHALDAGAAGLRSAWTTLRGAGIGSVGTAGTACAPTGGDWQGQLHLFAFNAVHDPQDSTEDPMCGRAWLDQAALDTIAAQRRMSAVPIVVLVHWGTEYQPTPDAEQQDWANKLVAAGADLVLGAHPHVVQPAEPITAGGRQGFVAYSLGNFVFDQPDQPLTSHSVVLRVLLDATGVGRVAAAPVAIRNGQPARLALTDPAAQAQLAALQLAASASGQRHAWRWDGTTFAETTPSEESSLAQPPRSADVDLRGNGSTVRVTLQDGLAQLWDGDRELWRNEAASWQVAGFTTGDADNDGRFEALLQLWKPDAGGVLRSHPFMVGWRGGKYRVFWGGSAVAVPIQAAAIGAVGGDRNALVVLEGGTLPGDAATHVAVLTWQGWTFQQQWHSPAGVFHRLALVDLDGDGVAEIVAE